MTRLSDLVESGVADEGVALGPLTTYKFGGPARWFVGADDADTVVVAIDAALADGMPYLVVGRGSNLVISDLGFDGLVIRLGGALSDASIDAEGVVSAGAAMPLPMLARMCSKQGRGGLEFLVAVPGSVGGAVRMNAGCHGSETGDWLLNIEVYRPGVGRISVDRSEMEMTYRHNSLPAGDIVLSACFRTEPRPARQSEEVMRAITQWRKENQPGGTFNAGSVFKNPTGMSAGRLIDSAGLKGHKVGGAQVSRRHANFFEADPGARAQDVHDLVWDVRIRVARATGVELEPEIRFAGDFAEFGEGQMPGRDIGKREPVREGD
ncbi:MAG: UDP-N-acetylmuramate dehydrogenase [bacterium]|nr:UDP-N-acetylmuramate dehydrogenase [bacterium]